MIDHQEYRFYDIKVDADGTCKVETQEGDIPCDNVHAAHIYIDRRIAALPKPWWSKDGRRSRK